MLYLQSTSTAPLKIFSYCKLKLVDEDLLEGIEIVLLVENEHSLLVVNGINRAETQRTIAIGYQDGITGNAGRSLITIRECLYI